MKTKRKLLYLPVETAARELDAKLLLALFALRQGFEVTICSSMEVRSQLHRLPTGIFLLSSFQRRSHAFARRLRRYGHKLIAWDEEGLVWLSPEYYAKRRVGLQTLQHVDMLFAWGKEHEAILRQAGVTTPILVTGNPRADLLRKTFLALHEKQAHAIREEHGDFILINSNFGWINLIGRERCQKSAEEIARQSGHPVAYIRHRQKIFVEMMRLTRELAQRLPERRIVVRPHPSEDPLVWRREVSGLENVVVQYDSRLVPWLLASRSMIHNGCTTAVEYALLGKVPISFDPVEDEIFDIPQPRRVSVSATSVDDVVRLIEASPQPDQLDATLQYMIANWGQDRLSAQDIAEKLKELAQPPLRLPMQHKLDAFIYALKKRFNKFLRPHTLGKEHLEHRFPAMRAEQIEERLHALASCLDISIPPLVIKSHGPRFFRIHAV